jgi:hypothetical protein
MYQMAAKYAKYSIPKNEPEIGFFELSGNPE